MFWHRRKLLEIEVQIKEFSDRLNETVSSCFHELGTSHSAMRQSLEKIEENLLLLQQGQANILNHLAVLADGQHTTQEKLVSMLEDQRHPAEQILGLLRLQGDSVKALHGIVSNVQESIGKSQQECAALQEKLLSALEGAEHTISEKVAEQGASVVESQTYSAKSLSDTATEVLTFLHQESQASVRQNAQLLEALQGSERIFSDKTAELASSIKDGAASVRSDMDTLNEAMRLLLVNILLNNLPEK